MTDVKYTNNGKEFAPQSKEGIVHEIGIEQYKLAFEQYKILIESINKINETRESSNNFWIGTNGVGLSVLAFLRDSQNIQIQHKFYLIMTLIIIGLIFTSSWISYLKSIKQSINLRIKYVLDLEKNFPVPVFSRIFDSPTEAGRKQTVLSALTVKEMLVPCIFFISYIFFAILLFFFPEEIMSRPSA
jgi:hypothetical protein